MRQLRVTTARVRDGVSQAHMRSSCPIQCEGPEGTMVGTVIRPGHAYLSVQRIIGTHHADQSHTLVASSMAWMNFWQTLADVLL